jgi:hypothetical protein
MTMPAKNGRNSETEWRVVRIREAYDAMRPLVATAGGRCEPAPCALTSKNVVTRLAGIFN